jgi:uncharacterized repeat protein (TIGR01451 family)
MYYPETRTRQLALKRAPQLWLVLAVLVGMLALLVAQAWPFGAASPASGVNLDLRQLPLAFVPNAGQTDTAVYFQAHDVGTTVFFTADEVMLALPTADGPAAVSLQFVGANPQVEVIGAGQLPGIVNYFIGADPARWRANVPTYGQVIYRQIYPGIDLTYDGVNGRLKGTYVVAPGVDPAQIGWSHAGAASVQVDQQTGNLMISVLAADGGQATVVEEAPIAWQEINGRHVPVDVHYAIAANGSIGFALGGYNPAYALTIDPAIAYSTFLGGGGFEDVEAIAVDTAGNLFLTGTTSSANFPTQNPFQANKRGDEDVFVAKINAAGNALIYSTFLGGGGDDEGYGIAIDAAGHAYVTGSTDSGNFPTQNALQSTRNGFQDAFVAKLNPAGNGLVYSTYLGGGGFEEGEGIAVDAAGHAYVTGATGSTNFPTTANSFQSSFGGGSVDAYVAKLSVDGLSLVYSTYLGGGGVDSGSAIVVDGAGAAYVAGDTASTNFPLQNALQNAKAGGMDAFVAKLNSSGGALVYSTYLGGGGDDTSYGIALDPAGSAYVTGETKSSNFPTVNALQSDSGESDAYVAKLAPDGGALVYSTYLGGDKADVGYDITVNSGGQAVVVGATWSADFPVVDAPQPGKGSANESDAFIAKLAADGQALVYSTFLGGAQADAASAVAVDADDDVYVAGVTNSINFPTQDPLQAALGGVADVFVAKLNDSAATPPTPTPDPDDPTPTPMPPPPPLPNLLGSVKYASRTTLGPDEELTFTIKLFNSSTTDVMADVSDALPAEFILVDGSITGGGVYDAATRAITWVDLTVPASGQLELTFKVTAVPVTEPTLVVNTAVITPADGEPFERKARVLLSPFPVTDDAEPPVVESVLIGDRDILTDQNVTLTIDARDDIGVEWMYIREWQLSTLPVPRWEVVQSTGWIPFAAEVDWTLGSRSGTHFVGVWVADGAFNLSQLDRRALDFASLIVPDQPLAPRAIVPYLVNYEAGTDVTAVLTTVSGNADIAVWYPDNRYLPDLVSLNPGTEDDTLSFEAPSTGVYLFAVGGRQSGAVYNLAINPPGGPEPWRSGAAVTTAVSIPNQAALSSDEPDMFGVSILNVSGLDPLSVAEAPARPGENNDPRPILTGSRKFASATRVGPNEPFTFTIKLRNSGTADGVADVSDTLPAELTLVADSITGGGVYDTATRTITWAGVAVPMRAEVALTFDVTHNVTEPKVVVNTAVITPADADSFERRFPVRLSPQPVTDDNTPPVINSVLIGDRDVLTDPNVTITIDATDDQGVTQMYVREYQLSTTPFPRWELTQSTGWIPFEAEFDWTLGERSGVHFVAVWVLDGGLNVSQIDRRALDYASLILPDESFEQRSLVPYLVHYEAGENVVATLTPSEGNADLFVWYPDSFGLPDKWSVNPGTAVDEVSFVAPSAGTYLFLVRGFRNSTYNLSITPAGGPEPWALAAAAPQSATMLNSIDAADADWPIHVLLGAGLDPLGAIEDEPAPPEEPVEPMFTIYLPVIMRNP